MDLPDSLQTSLGPSITIERELAADGRYRAFVARDSGLGREVVVELMPADVAAAVDFARFKREISFAGRLEDEHIVPLLSAGAADGVPYVISSYVEGDTLAERVAGKAEISVNDGMRMLRDVARALAHGHERGVLHRDLRTSDVIILVDDTATVANFGVARALYAAGAPGDPKTDNLTDIYAFGAVGYELLTGHPPAPELPDAIQKTRTSLPTGLAPLIMRCLSGNPAQRPQTAAQVVRELDEIISPTDNFLANLWPVESSTLAARSEHYKSRGILALVVVTVLMIIAGIVTWRTSDSASSSTPVVPPAKTIAVLPLQNFASDTATQYFANGVTDELRAAVAKLPGVQVSARNATLDAVTADSGNVRKVGDRLNVGTVLGGQIHRVGDKVHLVAQLRNLPDTAIIWTATYDRTAAEVYQLEDDVTRGVAGALHITVTPTQQFAARGAASATAHDRYLFGKFLQPGRSELEISQSLGMFQQALKADPKYVAAWAGVAECWMLLSDDFVSPKEAVPHLRDAVARGLTLDPTNAELGFAHGLVAYLYDLNGRAAQQYMGEAIATNPDLPNATKWYPQILWANGFSDSARVFLRQAVNRDSTSTIKVQDAWNYAKVTANALDALQYCGRLEALNAAAKCDALQQLDIGRVDQAVDMFRSAAKEAGPRAVDAQLAYATTLVTANLPDSARKVVAAVDREAGLPGSYMRQDDIALLHGVVGDNDVALQWYEKARVAGSAGIGALYWRT
ncbi:MAG: serine/threonine-protein kinase, partial [Gemmatimonadaceae bacterium]